MSTNTIDNKPLVLELHYAFATSWHENEAVALGDVKPGKGCWYIQTENRDVLEGTYYATKAEAVETLREYLDACDGVLGQWSLDLD